MVPLRQRSYAALRLPTTPKRFARAMPPGPRLSPGSRGISQVPWRPSPTCRGPPTPTEPRTRGNRPSPEMLPSMPHDMSASATTPFSGLTTTAYRSAVYASQRRSPGRHARLAPDWGPPWSGGTSTRRVAQQGFTSWVHGDPPCQGLPGARRGGRGVPAEGGARWGLRFTTRPGWGPEF